MLPFKKILCPTDFSEASYAAMNLAIELAGHFGADLWLLHVVPFSPDPPPLAVSPAGLLTAHSALTDAERIGSAERLLGEVAATRVPPGIKVRCEVKMGHADREIVCAAEDEEFDLLVIATHGVGGWRHLVFGSVAEAIVRQSHCPVLTVHVAPQVSVEPLVE